MKNAFANYDTEAWRILSRKIMRRDGWHCQATCGCTEPLSVHHIVPRIEGGSDDPANLITLCRNCHDEIEATSIRTAAEARAYAPRWHATVSWYPTEPRASDAGTASAPRKTQAKPTTNRTAKQVGIYMRLCHCGKWFDTSDKRRYCCSEACQRTAPPRPRKPEPKRREWWKNPT